jgi:uncharacterized protein
MEQALIKARARTISPRQLALDIPARTPRYWMGGDAYSTHLMNALSLLFPPGERFFMEAVRAFRGQVTDPGLLQQVRGFLSQEALHSREHTTFNRWLTSFGIDADAIEQAVADEIDQRKAKRTPLDDLAVTCALEHFTAIMAEGWLREAELRDSAVEPLRSLWTWHALEELEHKSVAYDVYRAVGGDYERRRLWMLRITFGFVVGVSLMHIRFMMRDGLLARPLYLAQRWLKYWGPRGVFTKLIPAYLRYYRRDFHPWEQDHAQLIADFERVLTRSTKAE